MYRSPPNNRNISAERMTGASEGDSSGWLFLYHFGVAKYLQEEYLPREGLPPVAYSGASGGALVASTARSAMRR